MHPLLHKLLISNRGKGFFKVESKAETEATVYLYDVITSDDFWGGITPMAFIKEIAAITAPVVHLRINSPGGDVFAARAMQQAIREHPSQFMAHIDGWCASAATFLPMVCDSSVIAPGSMFMIHNAWSIAVGNAKDFSDMANLLTKIDGSIASEYVAKTGNDLQQIVDWMDAETYFMDEEAVAAGFVDSVAEAAPKAQIDWDLSAYHFAPAQDSAKPTQALDQTEKTLESEIIEPEQTDNHPKNRPKHWQMLAA